jgi:hypothetical protein
MFGLLGAYRQRCGPSGQCDQCCAFSGGPRQTPELNESNSVASSLPLVHNGTFCESVTL